MATATAISFGPRFHPRTAPVTFWYIVASIALYLVLLVAGVSGELALTLQRALAFDPGAWTSRPWTLLTYPLLHLGLPFWVAFTLYVCWWMGVDCEQWWGSRVHAGFMATVTLALGLAMLLAGALGLPSGLLSGPAPLITSWITIFALRGPRRTIVLVVVPCPAWLVAALTVLTLVAGYGLLSGSLAVVATGGLAAAYFHWGHCLHTWLGSIGNSPARRALRAKRERDRRFKHLMVISGLADEDDEPKR